MMEFVRNLIKGGVEFIDAANFQHAAAGRLG
jgi:hypothetical protein